MTATALKWRRVEAGLYRAVGADGTVYEVERLDPLDYDRSPGERERWLVRANGTAFDAAGSLGEAKTLANA